MPLVKEQQHSWQWIAFWSQPRTEVDALHWCIAATKMSLVKTRQQCIAAKKWIWSIGHHPIQHISPPLFFIQQTSSINFISARLIFQLSRIFKKQHIFLIEIRIPMTGICEAWLLVFSAFFFCKFSAVFLMIFGWFSFWCYNRNPQHSQLEIQCRRSVFAVSCQSIWKSASM